MQCCLVLACANSLCYNVIGKSYILGNSCQILSLNTMQHCFVNIAKKKKTCSVTTNLPTDIDINSEWYFPFQCSSPPPQWHSVPLRAVAQSDNKFVCLNWVLAVISHSVAQGFLFPPNAPFLLMAALYSLMHKQVFSQWEICEMQNISKKSGQVVHLHADLATTLD